MSDRERLDGVTFGRIASTIAVRDLPRVLAFYVSVTGMHVTFANGDPAGRPPVGTSGTAPPVPGTPGQPSNVPTFR